VLVLVLFVVQSVALALVQHMLTNSRCTKYTRHTIHHWRQQLAMGGLRAEVQQRRFFSWVRRMGTFDHQWSAIREVSGWVAMQMGGWADMQAGGHGHDEGEGAHEGREEAGKEDGQAELTALRTQNHNGHQLAFKILSQSELQVQARMLCDVFEPTLTAHRQELNDHKTQAGCAEHEARKAAGDSFSECCDVAALLHSEVKLERYDITRSGTVGPGLAAAEACEAAFYVEQRRAEKLLDLILQLLSIRAWSEAYHAHTLPDMFAAALHPNAEVARSTFDRIKSLWTAIEAAEAHESKGRAGVDRLLNMLGFHKHQLVREFIATCMLAGWDPFHRDVQVMAARTFAVTGNTTYVNEDVFNLLRDKERQTKGRAASRYSSWWAAGTAEILKLTDMPSVQPLHEDWGSDDLPGHVASEGIFFPGSHKPADGLRLRELQRGPGKGQGWRKAGSSSNAAAVGSSVALRMMVEQGNFMARDRAWAGCLAKRVGTGLLEKATGNMYVSLGFEAYVICVWVLEQVQVPAGQAHDSSKPFFKLSTAIAEPQFLMCTAVQDEGCSFSGVPLMPCVPGKQPGGGMSEGILFQQTGPPEALLKLAFRVSPNIFLLGEAKLICQSLGIAPNKEETKKHDFIRVILLHLGFSQEELESLLWPEQNEEPDDVLASAFEIMDAETAEEFRALQAEDELNRMRQEVRAGSSQGSQNDAVLAGCRLPAQYITPPSLKSLIPGKGLLPGVALYKNPIKQSFLACFGGQTCRRTWGLTTGRSVDDAQKLCIEWLWLMHGGPAPSAQPEPAVAAASAASGSQGRGRGRGRRGRGGRGSR
jgi:hypothetical protein